MSFDEHYLRNVLRSLGDAHGQPARCIVGFSGGMDSTVLLHALVRSKINAPILALHVDHQLHADSEDWRRQAAAVASSLGVEFSGVSAEIDRSRGQGVEAAARHARYAAFQAHLNPGEWLLCAQHQDDQAETLLLNLLRGSGPLGLAGMPETRPLGSGLLVRPLLDVSRRDLEAYARAFDLSWLNDPANQDLEFDRNFLRHRVLPTLGQRWSETSASLSRSAALAGEAQALLEDLADADLETIAPEEPARVHLDLLGRLSPRRQRNALRHACSLANLPRPPAQRLNSLLLSMSSAAVDAEPLVTWPGVEARRYRGELFLLAAADPGVDRLSGVLRAGESLSLGPRLGRLVLEKSTGAGIPPDLATKGLDVVGRKGGEALRIAPGGRSQKLKKLLQSAGVLPWMRDFVPLLVHEGQLIAVADRWVHADIATTPGYRVIWSDAPTLVQCPDAEL